MFINLVGEVGEFASKIAKMIRKGHANIGEEFSVFPEGVMCRRPNRLYPSRILETKVQDVYIDELQKEAGDILWQLSGLCYVMGWDLEDIAQLNLDKLASRKERGKIDGDGDNR